VLSTPTVLDGLVLPRQCRTELAQPRSHRVLGHSVTVNLDWWNERLTESWLPGAPIAGIDGSGVMVTAGSAQISRQQLFTLAGYVMEGGEAALRLLWHVLAWGTGTKPRQCRKRLASVAAAPYDVAALLQRSTEAARRDPVAGYRLLYPDSRRYAIKHLGAAFFTKYLYFAGHGQPEHRALILDDRVAEALHRLCNWTSLKTGGHWPAETYARYCKLLTRWAREETEALGRPVWPDEIERWLFDHGVPESRRRRSIRPLQSSAR
jgi:hypothetical protein